MAARAEILGDTGANASGTLGRRPGEPRSARHRHPVRARHRRSRNAAWRSTSNCSAHCPASRSSPSSISRPSRRSSYAHEHFGYRDRLSEPAIEGFGDEPTPGSRRAAEAGRVLSRLSRRSTASPGDCPQPEILSRNGSYMAYRRLEEHVGGFREFLRQNGETRQRSRN